MVKPKQVGHLVINVSDVAASTKFYTEILGFEIAVQRPTATFLTCGDIHHDLALFQASEDLPGGGQRSHRPQPLRRAGGGFRLPA